MGRLRSTLRRWTAPLRSLAVILMYHRVFEASSDPVRLCVRPKHFAEHLEHLRRHYPLFMLRDLAGLLAAGRLPKRAVVVTFDDGYVDNLWHAKPLLEKHDVPATMSIATGQVGKDREFWTHELEKLLLLAPSLPERLEVALNGGTRYASDLGRWARLPAGAELQHAGWHLWAAEDPTPRHRAYREIRQLLLPLAEEEKEEVLENLFSQARVDSRTARPGYRAVTQDEIRQLAESGLIEIGSHTVTHCRLATQPPAAQRREVTRSKQFLEEILGRPVTSLSYPYGGWRAVGPTAIRLVEEAGYSAACSTVRGTVTRRANPYWLPRFGVEDWDGHEFARRLDEFFRTDVRS